MKRKLCALLLALVCLLTTMAGASFTDAANIQKTDAVNMLSAMGILTGYADGSFKPNGAVSRAEMAKMLYTICLDSPDQTAYRDVPTAYTDINGTWAAGYIKYCEVNGILTGLSGKQLLPNKSVTGMEAVRMLLVVMGYTRSNLSNALWQQTAMGLASDTGLLDGMDCDLSRPISRQYAAQLLANAMDADCVQWSKDTDGYVPQTKDGRVQTVGIAYLGLNSTFGTLVKVDGDSLSIAQNDADTADSTLNSTVFSGVTQDETAMLGHHIRILTKGDKITQVMGVAAAAGGSCLWANQTDLELDGTKLKWDGSSHTLNTNGIQLYEDGDYTKTVTSASDLLDKTSPNRILFVDQNDDGKLDLALSQTYTVAKVTNVSTKSIKAGGTEYKFADDNVQSGLAVDDYVVITQNGYQQKKDVVKASMQTGKVGGTKGDKDPFDQYEIDGVWYTRAADGYEMNQMKGGETVQYLLVNHVLYYMKSVSDVTTRNFSNVAMVLGLGTSLDGNQAKLLFMDGTTETILVRDGGELSFSQLVKGNLYEVGKDSKGKYSFAPLTTSEDYYDNYTAVDDGLIGGWSGNSPSGGKSLTKDSYKGVKIDSNAKVILYCAGDQSFAFTGGSQYTRLFQQEDSVISSGNGLAAFMIKATDKKDKDIIYLMAVAVNKMPELDNDHYGYIVGDSVLTTKTTLSYTIWDGTAYRAVVEQIGGTKLKKTDRLRGMVIGYSDLENDGTIDDPQIYGTEGDGMYIRPLKTVQGNQLTYTLDDVDKTFTMDSSTKVLYVNSRAAVPDEIGMTSGKIQPAVTSGGYLYPNTMLIPNGVSGVALLVVDTGNRLDVPGLYKSVNTKKISDKTTKAQITGADSAMMGDTLTVTVSDTKGATKTLTLENAVFADTGSAARTVTMTKRQKYSFTIRADGQGTVDLKISAS